MVEHKQLKQKQWSDRKSSDPKRKNHHGTCPKVQTSATVAIHNILVFPKYPGVGRLLGGRTDALGKVSWPIFALDQVMNDLNVTLHKNYDILCTDSIVVLN